MKLTEVLKGVVDSKTITNLEIKGVSYDSRKVQKGYLFVAIKGFQTDGHNFLAKARENGALAALVQDIDNSVDIYQIKINDTRLALAQTAANFYNKPSNSLYLIGITGTNGKTTTSFILESIFKAAKHTTSLMGTVRSSIGDNDYIVEHTTPESLELQKFFCEALEQSSKTAIIEVSSHAIDLKRVASCQFDQIIFTNLTQDHLDYHKTLDAYFAVKAQAFKDNANALHVINIDDEYGKRLLSKGIGSNVVSYGMDSKADYVIENIIIDNNISQFSIRNGDSSYDFKIGLGGQFNVYNATAAIVSALNAGVDASTIQNGLDDLVAVPGRFEVLPLNAPFKVIIDYAHTPDGLKNLLTAARQVTKGKLITIFGCGGERDRGKRPLMGNIAVSLSDQAIVTSDNPRGEDPAAIISEVINDNDDFIIEIDRKSAIKKGLEIASEGDTLVIAGKGHEETQEINKCHIPFKDQDVATQLWEELSKVK